MSGRVPGVRLYSICFVFLGSIITCQFHTSTLSDQVPVAVQLRVSLSVSVSRILSTRSRRLELHQMVKLHLFYSHRPDLSAIQARIPAARPTAVPPRAMDDVCSGETVRRQASVTDGESIKIVIHDVDSDSNFSTY
jgi:hypothetical protein